MKIGTITITTSKNASTLAAFAGTLARIESKVDQLIKGEAKIMADLTKLESDVAAEVTASQSAITLLTGLKAALDAAGTDPTKLAALSSSLEANTAALAAAITANTPAAGAVA